MNEEKEPVLSCRLGQIFLFFAKSVTAPATTHWGSSSHRIHYNKSISPMKALVFQDDPELGRSISASLTQWGYEAITASDVDTVCRILREDGAPQIAIVDCRIGYDLVKKIREFTSGNYVFVLAITSDNCETSLLEAMEAGANDCLTKPVEERALEARLRAAQRVIELEQALTAKAAVDPLTGI